MVRIPRECTFDELDSGSIVRPVDRSSMIAICKSTWRRVAFEVPDWKPGMTIRADQFEEGKIFSKNTRFKIIEEGDHYYQL